MTIKTIKYRPESIGSIMATEVLICRANDKLSDVIKVLKKEKFDNVHNVYVVDDSHKLLGIIDATELLNADDQQLAKDVYQKPTIVLSPNSDREQAVYYAVKEDLISIPIVDHNNHFLGAVTSHAIIDVMHEEHIEDTLLTAGIRIDDSINLPTALSRISVLVKARAPWLVFGLIAGLMLGFMSSWFEDTLKESVAIAYFIPVVAYVAGSVGSQASAIAIRALSFTKINYKSYLFKEFLIGIFLGIIVGAIGFIGAIIIVIDLQVAIIVALSLALASVIASVLASMIPFIFKKIGKDPALGSGPIATALLDVISVLCYFLIAVSLL
jgi:magnesium transporter